VSGTSDLRIQQPFDEPYLRLQVERTKAEQLGFTAHDIAQNLLVSLSGSFQTSPTFWVDPKNRVSYQIATQTPQYRTATLQDLQNIPVTGTDPTAPESIMASLVSVQRGAGMAAAWRTGITWKHPHRHNRKQQTKHCRSSDSMWKLSCRSISIARTQICWNQAPGNRAFNGEFTFQQPAQILPRNSRELEKAVAENTNLNFMAETFRPGRCSRRLF